MNAPASLTLGVEEEFLLVDAAGRLSRQGPAVAALTDSPDGELQQELTRCQVESATGICSTADEVVGQLGELRRRLALTAAVLRVFEALREQEKPVGVNAFDPAQAQLCLDAGASFVLVGADVSLLARGSEALAERYIPRE